MTDPKFTREETATAWDWLKEMAKKEEDDYAAIALFEWTRLHGAVERMALCNSLEAVRAIADVALGRVTATADTTNEPSP